MQQAGVRRTHRPCPGIGARGAPYVFI